MDVALARINEEWDALGPARRAAWCGFLGTHAAVVRELDAELEAAHGLSLGSFDVLIQLAMAPGGRLQMFLLADAVRLSRSGLSRHVERLERTGLVERHKGVDPRTCFAVITEQGVALLAEATPTHLAGVRRGFLDRLPPELVNHLADAWERLLTEPVSGGGNDIPAVCDSWGREAR